ncbi:hypothetical protein EG68_12218 [Paragonimus skrjabini miyazakii]|uniref:Uncharacterized protein n=1 Tax=Paragonimus skrjabini miyazakii TaxID=59628 RepID=A0A8S9YCX7_9TREM|nr:hypothetical protein EG68_12218 [Paragonimus skrjabini miyazakii]
MIVTARKANRKKSVADENEHQLLQIRMHHQTPHLDSRGTPMLPTKSFWSTCDVGSVMRTTERAVAQSVSRSHPNQRMSTWMPTSEVCQIHV